ncbi:MAG: hypothetical protein CMQ34_00370 [Gammaproteobacteria bacterium]|nr:hypothetical protein [Gammaproteobacteria bacterium]|tara:strand:- start:2064 stop:3059 length:996 start_codon:yes stop_codon:yes gene_type:complete
MRIRHDSKTSPIGVHLDRARQAWRGFAAQPGNTHIALAAALLLGLVLLVAVAGGSEVDSVSATRDQVTDTDRAVVVADEDTLPVTPAEPEASTGAIRSEAMQADTSATLMNSNRLAIILDDIGYSAEAGERAVKLPGAVTYAVLPFTPHGQALARMAHDAGKEVMLHAPMSNLAGMALGEGGLTLALPEEEFVRTLRAAIADIPHVVGVNNHTGSELTAAEQPMQWVMRELKAQGLFFVDSMTTGKSVAEKIAIDNQVPALKRHVFLDNEATPEAIDREFQRAVAIAQQLGFAVAIGHPYPETLDYLEQAITQLPAHSITLVPASALLRQP